MSIPTSLRVITLSTIVIALSSVGVMITGYLNHFEKTLLPSFVYRIILVAIIITTLYYCSKAIMLYRALK